MKTLLALAFATLTFDAWALGDPVTDPTAIQGCWRREIYSDEQMRRLSEFDFYDAKLQKYQWFCFLENGVFRALTTRDETAFTKSQIEAMFTGLPTPMSWKLTSMGVVRIEHRDDENQNFFWLVSFATEPTRLDKDLEVAPGTLFMGLLNKQRTSYALLRVLQRVK